MHAAPTNGISYFYLMLAASVVAILTRRIRGAPYALVLVIAGLLLGLPRWLPTVRLEPHVLFTVFLPPLLFESALQLRMDALKREVRPVLLLSVGATLFSTFVIGFLASWILRLPLPSALVFGALISATDPISVIAVFRQLGASRRLTLLVDAEALFNDGVAVVLFTVLLAAATGTHVTLWSGVWLFSANAAGGIAIGAAIGFIASRVTHHVDDHLLEITLTTIVAWGSYLAADALHVSGVLAVITGGLVVGSYGMAFSMTPTTKLAVTAFWEYAAFAVNSVVFLIVGIEEARTGLLFRSLPFALCAALVVLGGRLTVYPIAWVCNRLGSGIGRGEQHVLFWGGLRGALSMALALGLERSFPARDAVLTATFGAVLFSLLAQGLTIGPLLRRLGLVRADNAEEARKERAYLAALQLATRAGLKELDRLDSADEFPNWALDAMRAEYAARAEALTAAHVDLAARSARGGADLAVAAPVSALEHTREIRRRLLSAERIALNAVAHEDPIDAESLRALIGRIDAQLLAHAADR